MTEEEMRQQILEERQDERRMAFVDDLRLKAEKTTDVFYKAYYEMLADRVEHNEHLSDHDKQFLELTP